MEIPRHWRLKEQRYQMIGNICSRCETKFFPPRDICSNCNQNTHNSPTSNGKGEIQSYTIVNDPLGSENTKPYAVALVKLDEGQMVVAQLIELDGHNVEIGTLVEILLPGRNGNIDSQSIFRYKFEPVTQKQGIIYEAPP